MAELRWILLGLGLLSIGAIWWWSARRSGQAAGDSELREPSAAVPAQASAAPTQALSASGATQAGEALRSERGADPIGAREWGIPPLEPLHIRTGEFEQIPEFDEPMSALAEPLEAIVDIDEEDMEPVVQPAAPVPAAPAARAGEARRAQETRPAGETRTLFEEERSAPRPRPSPEHSDRHSVETPQTANASQSQKIVTLRVCAVGEVRWAGSTLMHALESLGLAFGQYQVYHRKHGDGRSIFCVASLVEPGSFDTATMAEDEFRGVTFFAVLPGPLAPLDALDALIATARDLARELGGTMQDARGVPFSPQRAAALREDVARFQAQLP